jgi:hypothetical protein
MAAGPTHTNFHVNLQRKMDCRQFVSLEEIAECLQIVGTGIDSQKTVY